MQTLLIWDGWRRSRQNHLGGLEMKFISGFFLMCEHSDGSLVCSHEPESRPSGLFQHWAGMTQFTCQRISQYWWTSTASGPKKEERARTFLWFYLWLYMQNKYGKKYFILYLGLEYNILKLIFTKHEVFYLPMYTDSRGQMKAEVLEQQWPMENRWKTIICLSVHVMPPCGTMPTCHPDLWQCRVSVSSLHVCLLWPLFCCDLRGSVVQTVNQNLGFA